MKKLGLVALATLFLSGCATQTYIVSNAQSASMASHTEGFQHFFVGGIGQTVERSAVDTCKNGATKVQTHQSFLNSLASGITYTIYSPRELRLYCK